MEFVIMGRKGPEHSLGIDDQAHWEMIGKARELKLPLFERFANYYGDARVLHKELAAWLEQIQALQQETISSGLAAFLRELTSLAQTAAALGQTVYGLGD